MRHPLQVIEYKHLTIYMGCLYELIPTGNRLNAFSSDSLLVFMTLYGCDSILEFEVSNEIDGFHHSVAGLLTRQVESLPSRIRHER